MRVVNRRVNESQLLVRNISLVDVVEDVPQSLLEI